MKQCRIDCARLQTVDRIGGARLAGKSEAKPAEELVKLALKRMPQEDNSRLMFDV